MSPTRLSNYWPSRGPRARPDTARNSNGPGWPEIQIIRAFSVLGRAGPGGPNVYLYLEEVRREMKSGSHESMGDGTAQEVFESGMRVPPVSDRVRNRDISPGFSPFGTVEEELTPGPTQQRQ
jgi:hypothetical protein